MKLHITGLQPNSLFLARKLNFQNKIKQIVDFWRKNSNIFYEIFKPKLHKVAPKEILARKFNIFLLF